MKTWFKSLLFACTVALFAPSMASAQPHPHARSIMPPHEFNQLYNTLKHTSDSGWEAILRKAIQNYDLTCSQIISLVDILGYYGDQADTACFFAKTNSIADPENWYKIITSRVSNRGQELITKCTPRGARLPTPAEISAASHRQVISDREFAVVLDKAQRTDDDGISRFLKDSKYYQRYSCEQIYKLSESRFNGSYKAKVICLMADVTADPEHWNDTILRNVPRNIYSDVSNCAPKGSEIAPPPAPMPPAPPVHPAPMPPAPPMHPAPMPPAPPVHPAPMPPAPPAIHAMNAPDFNHLVGAVKKEHFSDDQIAVIRNASHTNHFTCEQVKQLVKLLAFDDDRIKAACMLADRVVDKNNWFSVSEALSFSDSKQKVMNCLH